MCLLLAVPPHQHKTIFTIKNELKKLFPTCCRLGKLLNEIVTIVTELKVNGGSGLGFEEVSDEYSERLFVCF